MVLAAGFVVGRIVVARLYVSQAPQFPKQEMSELDASAASHDVSGRRPGRVYVPPPAPPEEPPEAPVGLSEAVDEWLPDESRGPDGMPVRAMPQTSRHRGEQEGQARTSPAPQTVERDETQLTPRQPQTQPQAAPARYSVQVGMFSSAQGARKLEDELREAGYSTRIEVEAGGGVTRYRVLAGSYRTEYAARKAVEHLRRDGFEAFFVER
jgi:cell division protein FtsN